MGFAWSQNYLAEEVDGLVCGLRGECVERGEGREFDGAAQHVSARTLACLPHILQRGRPQQLCDQLQLVTNNQSQIEN